MTSQVSHPYNSTDFTQALNILILVSFRNDLDSHTFLSLENESTVIKQKKKEEEKEEGEEEGKRKRRRKEYVEEGDKRRKEKYEEEK